LSDEVILEHYRNEAEKYGLAAESTIDDLTIREVEVDSILRFVEHVTSGGSGRLLEAGCGNGHVLQILRDRFPGLDLWGCDYSPEMIALARERSIDRCDVQRQDVRSLGYETGTFDVVVTERCLINLLDVKDQAEAIRELGRVVRPGGHAVLVEAFTDGADNLNRARSELGMPPISAPFHNLWFDKDRFKEAVEPFFDLVDASGDLPPSNVLSTHYFVSRVLYPAVTQREILYNTEFVRFFRILPPHGEFSPIQPFLLRRKATSTEGGVPR
jgi:SAM-dependent methyltransferase